jgi:hypothetical protein
MTNFSCRQNARYNSDFTEQLRRRRPFRSIVAILTDRLCECPTAQRLGRLGEHGLMIHVS